MTLQKLLASFPGIDFLYLDICLGHEHAEIDVRYFPETMGITTGDNWKGESSFSKEHREQELGGKQRSKATYCLHRKFC